VLAVDPASRFLLTGGQDRLLRAWPMLQRAQLQQAQRAPPAPQTFLGHPDAVRGIALLAGAAVTVCDGGCVMVWDVAVQQEEAGDKPGQQGQGQAQEQAQQPVLGGGITAKGWPPLGPDGQAAQLADLGRDAGVAAPDAGRQDQWRIRAARPGSSSSSSPAPALPLQVRAAPPPSWLARTCRHLPPRAGAGAVPRSRRRG
jgi:hypothetical protein